MDSRTGLLQPVLGNCVASGCPAHPFVAEAHELLDARSASLTGILADEVFSLAREFSGEREDLPGVSVACTHCDDEPPPDVAQVGHVERGAVGLRVQPLQHGRCCQVMLEKPADEDHQLVSMLLAERTFPAGEARAAHLSFCLGEHSLAEQPVGVVALHVQPQGFRAVLTRHHGSLELSEGLLVALVQEHRCHDSIGLREREVSELISFKPSPAVCDASLGTICVEFHVHGQGHVLRLERGVADDRVGHFLPLFSRIVEVLSCEIDYNICVK